MQGGVWGGRWAIGPPSQAPGLSGVSRGPAPFPSEGRRQRLHPGSMGLLPPASCHASGLQTHRTEVPTLHPTPAPSTQLPEERRAGLPRSPEEEQQESHSVPTSPVPWRSTWARGLSPGRLPGLLASRSPSLSRRPGGFRGGRAPTGEGQPGDPLSDCKGSHPSRCPRCQEACHLPFTEGLPCAGLCDLWELSFSSSQHPCDTVFSPSASCRWRN